MARVSNALMVVSTNALFVGVTRDMMTHALVTQSTASLMSHLVSSDYRCLVRRAPTTTAASVHDEDDDIWDRHEFEPETANATSLSVALDGATPSMAVISDDPLQALGNLTERMVSFTRQFEYHVSVARDERGKLGEQLQESQEDRKKLNDLIQQLRSDKDTVEEKLKWTVEKYENETQQREAEVQLLRTSASQDRKALREEQARVVALKHTVDEQEHYINRTETSTRHLLILLGKLLLRRLERLIIYVFPFVAQLIKSIVRFFAFWNTDEDEDEGAQPSSSELGAAP